MLLLCEHFLLNLLYFYKGDICCFFLWACATLGFTYVCFVRILIIFTTFLPSMSCKRAKEEVILCDPTILDLKVCNISF